MVRTSWVPILLALLLLLAGFAVLDDYNVTWDEGLGDFFFGERYLSYFTSFDARYLDFAANPYPEGHVPDLSVSPFRNRPWEYYPAANVLAAASSRVLSGWLGLVDPFDGFHAVSLLLAALFLPLFFAFGRTLYGTFEALCACLLLFLMPRVVCHLMANIKDLPEMLFFAATLMTFYFGWQRASVRLVLLSGLVGGLALATKANALFVPPILLLFVLLYWRLGRESPWQGRERSLWVALVAAGGLGAGLMVALWPYLWPDPVGRFRHHFEYVSGQVFQVRGESLADPLAQVLLTTPPLFLALVAVGLVRVSRRAYHGGAGEMLLLSWVAVVLGRLYLPGAVNFDGVRHFLELMPALALVAAGGLGWLVDRLTARVADARWRRAVPVAALVLAVLPSLIAVVRTHPHQIAYWNVLAGGVSGARARGYPQAGDYWGMSYRQGLRWLDENAEPGSVLAVPILQHTVALVAPQRLRHDIGLAAISVPNFPRLDPRRLEMLRQLARERPVYVMFVLRADWENELMRECQERLEPVAEWSLDGAPLLQIYRYAPLPS